MTNEPIDEQELIESINRNDYFWISKINFKNTECRVLQDIFIVKGKKFEHINVFIYAILANKITVVSLFVNSPMKSNFMYESWTPLHLVAFLNYVEIANLLLANEYPLDVKDNELTPVTLAAIENSIHVMDSFLHSGQKFDLQIPLQNALAQMNYEIAEMLVNSGADPSPFKDNMNLKKREKFSQVHDIFKKGAESFSLHFILPENPLPIYNSSPVIHPITVIKQKIPDKHT